MEISNQDMARIFKALSNEQRLKLFKMLYYWNESMGDICGVERSFSKACETFNLSKSTISHHFKELQLAGLITCTKQGQHQCCTINKEVLTSIKAFFEEIS